MANLKYYLDISAKNTEFFSLRLAINHKSNSAYITTPIKLLENQWDKKSEKIINHPQAKMLNNSLINQKSFYITKLMQLEQEVNIYDFSAKEIKYLLIDKPEQNIKTVKDIYDELMESKKNEGTRHTYDYSIAQNLNSFSPIDKLSINKIDAKFVNEFDKFIIDSNVSDNTRYMIFCKVKALINFAKKKGYYKSNLDPFVDIDIEKKETRKRNLNIDKLRVVLNYKSDNKHEQFALDVFKLSFFLIGINNVDLFSKKLQINDDRLEYWRIKTGKFISVKIPDVVKDLLPKVIHSDLATKSKSINSKINTYLQIVSQKLFGNKDLSSYWARHTWATIAVDLGVSVDTVSYALGHKVANINVTNVYIQYNRKKVDEANQKVIDYVLGNK